MKFIDFGTARQNTGTLANTLARGTLIYMSPELFICCFIEKNKDVNLISEKKSNTFSIGLLTC